MPTDAARNPGGFFFSRPNWCDRFVDFRNVWLAYNEELLAKGHFAVET